MKKQEDAAESMHWADQAARRIVKEKGKKERYVCAAGISPSGTVHIGNFREIITVDLVARALAGLGKKVRFIYSWDDYDVFRKVPSNMLKPEELRKFLRKPITMAPDTFGCHKSYAEHNEKEVEELLPSVGAKPEFIYQHKKYQHCDYKDETKFALNHRNEIRKVLDNFREEPLSDNWYPLSIYCEKCCKDTVKITGYDGNYTVKYKCECGFDGDVDFSKKGIVKLLWRVDWPMRWKYEQVDFESGGKDHYSAGGSRDTCKEVVKIFGYEEPVGFMYDFIRIKGADGKISSSKGNVITLKDVLEVYEPEIVRWLFAGTRPNTEFAISFDLDVLKIYEDFDRCERIYFKKEDVDEKEYQKQKRIYELSAVDAVQKKLPYQPLFRHLTNVLQIYDRDIKKAMKYYEKELKTKFERERFATRAKCALNWLEKYAPDDFKFRIQEKCGVEIGEKERAALKKLASKLKENDHNEKTLFEEFYNICRETGIENKDFFRAAYLVLIKKEMGPKLAPFILEIGKEKVIKLFEQV